MKLAFVRGKESNWIEGNSVILGKGVAHKFGLTRPIGAAVVAVLISSLPTLADTGAVSALTQKCSQKIWGTCLVRPDTTNSSSIFGFSDLVTALALLVVLYTISSVRYRFRIAVAPVPLQKPTFVLLLAIGALTLLTDLWFQEVWLVPSWLASQALLQGALGSAFLLIVMTWIYFGFIAPPVFGPSNYEHYVNELYRLIVKGSVDELPEIASELARSADSIIGHCAEMPHRRIGEEEQEGAAEVTKPGISEYAHDLLLLIGDRRFCRHVVSSSPGTAIELFDAAGNSGKHRLPLGQFARNITTEALLNSDSILFHEDSGYESGLIGYVKPFSKAIYANYPLAESLAEIDHSPLDVDYRLAGSWNASQMSVYCRVTLLTLKDYLDTDNWHRHSYALTRAFYNIEHSCWGVMRLNDSTPEIYGGDVLKRLDTAVDFIGEAVGLVDEMDNPPVSALKTGRDAPRYRVNMYDKIAKLIFNIIKQASFVKGPRRVCWTIQHNSVWGRIHGLASDTQAWKFVHFKLHRLIFDEIVSLENMPNYQNAAVLGFCLNVLGLKEGTKEGYGREYYALRKAVLSWTRKNYLALHQELPHIAAACLAGSITFDAEKRCLIKTYEKSLSGEAAKQYLELLERPSLDAVSGDSI